MLPTQYSRDASRRRFFRPSMVSVTDSVGDFRIERGPNEIVFISVPYNYQIVGRFWRSVADSPPRIEFALVEAKSPETFTFAHASHTHISPASINRTQRLRVLVDSMRPAFVLIAGYLVKDALRVPEAEGLNIVDIDGSSYCGHVDCVQLAWLKRDLARTPSTQRRCSRSFAPDRTFSHWARTCTRVKRSRSKLKA